MARIFIDLAPPAPGGQPSTQTAGEDFGMREQRGYGSIAKAHMELLHNAGSALRGASADIKSNVMKADRNADANSGIYGQAQLQYERHQTRKRMDEARTVDEVKAEKQRAMEAISTMGSDKMPDGTDRFRTVEGKRAWLANIENAKLNIALDADSRTADIVRDGDKAKTLTGLDLDMRRAAEDSRSLEEVRQRIVNHYSPELGRLNRLTPEQQVAQTRQLLGDLDALHATTALASIRERATDDTVSTDQLIRELGAYEGTIKALPNLSKKQKDELLAQRQGIEAAAENRRRIAAKQSKMEEKQRQADWKRSNWNGLWNATLPFDEILRKLPIEEADDWQRHYDSVLKADLKAEDKASDVAALTDLNVRLASMNDAAVDSSFLNVLDKYIVAGKINKTDRKNLINGYFQLEEAKSVGTFKLLMAELTAKKTKTKTGLRYREPGSPREAGEPAAELGKGTSGWDDPVSMSQYLMMIEATKAYCLAHPEASFAEARQALADAVFDPMNAKIAKMAFEDRAAEFKRTALRQVAGRRERFAKQFGEAPPSTPAVNAALEQFLQQNLDSLTEQEKKEVEGE